MICPRYNEAMDDPLLRRRAPDILPDLLRPGLDLVICGTAAGAISAARGAYYANPGNRFWSVLAETGLTPHRFRPEEFPRLTALGIGLTDVCKSAAGQDDSLPREGFDRARLAAAMRHHRPRLLAFNSKRAAAEFLGLPTGRIPYGPVTLDPALPDLPPIVVLPSTSGLACRAWDAAPWRAMAALVLAWRAAPNLGNNLGNSLGNSLGDPVRPRAMRQSSVSSPRLWAPPWSAEA
jgi:TDG/mug DNA glycosylase family protein